MTAPETARQSALDRLTSAAEGTVTLLLGEAGIGKTRVLEALTAGARTPVRAARGAVIDRDLPLGVVAELLDAERGLDPTAIVADALGAPAADARAVAAALAEHCAGTLVVVDDAHWADAPSLAVLRHLARRPAPGMRIVLAAREADGLADESTALVHLEPLTAAEARRLAPDLAPDRVERLRRASGGNALLLSELARAERDGRPASARTVAPLVQRRVSALGPEARALLEAAAAAGDPCPASLVTAVSALEDPGAALDELVAAALLEPAGPGGRLAFRHPVVRAAVHEGISPTRRRALHAAVLAALRAQGAPVAALAPHLLEVAEPGDAEAVGLLMDAAAAVRGESPHTAVRWLRSAIELAPGEQAAEVTLALGTSLLESGDPAGCLALLSRQAADPDGRMLALESVARRQTGQVDGLAGRLRRAEAAEPAPEVGALLAVERAALLQEVELDFDGAARLAVSAAATARAAHAPAVAAASLALAAINLSCSERRAAARPLAADAEVLLEAESDPARRVQAGVWLGDFHLYGVGEPSRAARAYDRVHRDALAGGSERAIAPVLARAAFAHALTGRVESALAAAERAEDLAAQEGSPFGAVNAAIGRCWAELWAGQVERAVAVADRYAQQAAASPWAAVGVVWSWMSGQVYAAAGRPEVAIAQITRQLGEDLAASEPLGGAFAQEVLVRACVATGELERARAAVAARRAPDDLPLAQAMCALAHAHLARAEGDVAAAAGAADRCAALAESVGSGLAAARGALLAAAVLGDAGRRRRAVAHAWAAGLRVTGWDDDLPGAAVPGAAPDTAVPALAALSPRQREVALLLGEGRTNVEIAAALGLSVHTVGDHVSAVLHRLGVTRRSAVGRALGLGVGQ